MSSLDNLTSKILEDANIKAENIIKEAKEKETDIINKKKSAAEKIAENVIEKAKLEGKSLFDRGISKAELKVRNEKLVAKQTVINRVFEEAVKELNNMSNDKFLAYIKKNVKLANVTGDEKIIVSSKDKEKITEEFLKELNDEIKGNLSLSDECREIGGGFILAKGGIEINFSYKDIISSLRYELENQIAVKLFS